MLSDRTLYMLLWSDFCVCVCVWSAFIIGIFSEFTTLGELEHNTVKHRRDHRSCFEKLSSKHKPSCVSKGQCIVRETHESDRAIK